MGNDPWKHRSSGMKCKTCMWFVGKEGGIVYTNQQGKVLSPENMEAIRLQGIDAITEVSTSHTQKSIGRCRRHAPTLNGYPVVFKTDWCGDHKLNEESL